MLVLSRQIGERFVLETSDGPVYIKIVRSSPDGVRVGFEAPDAVSVLREELITPTPKPKNPRCRRPMRLVEKQNTLPADRVCRSQKVEVA